MTLSLSAPQMTQNGKSIRSLVFALCMKRSLVLCRGDWKFISNMFYGKKYLSHFKRLLIIVDIRIQKHWTTIVKRFLFLNDFWWTLEKILSIYPSIYIEYTKWYIPCDVCELVLMFKNKWFCFHLVCLFSSYACRISWGEVGEAERRPKRYVCGISTSTVSLPMPMSIFSNLQMKVRKCFW